MAFCTVVEWDQDLGEALGTMPGNETQPTGCLVRIIGSSDKGSYVIELWNAADDARRIAEQPASAQSSLPPPARVDGFETSVALISAGGSG